MQNTFHSISPAHLAAIVMVPAVAAVLAAAQRKIPRAGGVIRYSLVCLLLLCSISYYSSFPLHGDSLFPNHLPLEICDASLFMAVATLLVLKAGIFDLAYYWALTGSALAMVTPNLTQPSLFTEVEFFASHGLTVTAILYLVWSRQARPRLGSARRAMVGLNAMAVVVGTFDAVFHTNYMFLRAKPQGHTVIDFFGPWPWYIAVCELLAAVLFTVLYLPFRRRRLRGPKGSEREKEPAEVPALR